MSVLRNPETAAPVQINMLVQPTCIRSYCDRGVRAGTMEHAEAEFEAEELFDVNFEQIGEIAL